jgi:hypothetical protein
MGKEQILKFAEMFRYSRYRRYLQKLARALACIVVFCTTYALILPAITVEKEYFCGYEEHFHTDFCYVEEIAQTQNDNYRYLSTAGIARAELGLKTTYNAAANAQGAGTPDVTETSPDANDVQSVAEQVYQKQQKLTELPASVSSIGHAMRVQTLMNLELAQRINLSNALQSSILSIEAARELKNAGTRRNN